MNKRYTVAQVRERLSDALDEAEKGVPVIIERRGVRFQLVRADAKARRPRQRAPRIEVLDPTVVEGQWTWAWTPAGMKFRAGRKR
jgi:antitoxin (DNA-binding transcriptional repressor) of toxin-antitoxin stability system